MTLQCWSFLYGVLAGLGLYALYKRLKEKEKIKEEKVSPPNDYDCVFFSPETFSLTCHKNETNQCCKVLSCSPCNLKKVFFYVSDTKNTLDICMYLITSEKLTNLVLKLFKNGVFVRIIVDKHMSGEAHNSKKLTFIKRYIPIKLIDKGEMMHNKFVVIDNKVLITGSFNWTTQAFMYNYENAVVVRNEEVVQKYSDYFQNIWLTKNDV